MTQAGPGAPPPRLVLIECPALEAPEGAAADGVERLRRFGQVIDALSSVCPWVDAVRPGVCTLPIKGPARYFGTEEAVLDRVGEAVRGALQGAGHREAPGADGANGANGAAFGGPAFRLGVAEGVFAATLAAKAGVTVSPGETPRFLAPWPVDVLGDPELADVLVRLGLSTLGRFAALPAPDVLARFGASGARCHRVARGLDGELPGYRMPGTGARLVAALGRSLALEAHQPGFWGGTSAADERAAEVLIVLQRRLGPETVAVPVLEGGRGPADRCRLVPWRPPAAAPEPEGARRIPPEPPWPGRLPPPAPARVIATGRPAGPSQVERVDQAHQAHQAHQVELAGEDGAPVGVSGRGLLTGTPWRLSLAGGPWTSVAAWSAPWPAEERWWSRARRRAARLQVLTVDGAAYLLVTEHGRWRVEAVYD